MATKKIKSLRRDILFFNIIYGAIADNIKQLGGNSKFSYDDIELKNEIFTRKMMKNYFLSNSIFECYSMIKIAGSSHSEYSEEITEDELIDTISDEDIDEMNDTRGNVMDYVNFDKAFNIIMKDALFVMFIDFKKPDVVIFPTELGRNKFGD